MKWDQVGQVGHGISTAMNQALEVKKTLFMLNSTKMKLLLLNQLLASDSLAWKILFFIIFVFYAIEIVCSVQQTKNYHEREKIRFKQAQDFESTCT